MTTINQLTRRPRAPERLPSNVPLDCAGVEDRRQGRSKYGPKRPKQTG